MYATIAPASSGSGTHNRSHKARNTTSRVQAQGFEALLLLLRQPDQKFRLYASCQRHRSTMLCICNRRARRLPMDKRLQRHALLLNVCLGLQRFLCTPAIPRGAFFSRILGQLSSLHADAGGPDVGPRGTAKHHSMQAEHLRFQRLIDY